MSSKKAQENIAAQIAAGMTQTGVIPWSNPIHRKGHDGTPHNLASEKPYSGGNIFVLNSAMINGGYKDNLWLTSRQIRMAGGRVKTGQAAVKILKYLHFNPTTKELLPVPPKVGEKRMVPVAARTPNAVPEFSERMTTEEERWIPLLRTAFVYNAEQAEGEKVSAAAKRLRAKLSGQAIPVSGDPFVTADKIALAAAKELGVTIEETPNAKHLPAVASYDHAAKRIRISAFKDSVDSTEAHALWLKQIFTGLAHAAGEKLARPLREGVSFGDTKPGFERLTAEMSASMTLADLEIPVPRVTDKQLAAAWAAAITNDPGMLFAAHRHAMRASNLIAHGVTPEQLAKETTVPKEKKGQAIRPEVIVEESKKPEAKVEKIAAPAQKNTPVEEDPIEPQTCVAIDYYHLDENGRQGVVKTAVFRNEDPETISADDIGEIIYDTTLRSPDGGFNPLALNLPAGFREGSSKAGAGAWHILKDVREVVQKPTDSRTIGEFKSAWLAIGANWSASAAQTLEKADAAAKESVVKPAAEAEKGTVVRVTARKTP